MKNNGKKILSVVLAASMLLAMGVTAFASETADTDSVEGRREYFRNGSDKTGRFGLERERMQAPGVRLAIGGRLLDEMAEKDIIDENDVEAIESFIQEQRELTPEERAHPEDGEGPLVFLVDEGVISQETADDIAAGLEVLREERREEFAQSIIDEGILTEDEMEDVLEFMEECRAEREELRDELSEMTWAERREYIEANREDFQGPFEKMVEEGLITEDQADEIRDLFPGNRLDKGQRGPKRFKANFERGAKNGVPFGGGNGARFTPLMDAEEL